MRQNLAYLFYSFFPADQLRATREATWHYLCLLSLPLLPPLLRSYFWTGVLPKNISLHWPLAFTEHLDYSVVDWSILEKTLNLMCFSWPLAVGLFLLRFALVLFGIYSFLMATIFNRWPW